MRDPRFWDSEYYARLRRERNISDDCACTLQMIDEGNRLIAREIVNGIKRLWQALKRQSDAPATHAYRHRHFPPL